MKKNSFYLFAMMMVMALCVGFTSCGDDDDDDGGGGSGSASALVGTWQRSAIEFHYDDGEIDVENKEHKNQFIHFNANGTGTSYERWENEWELYDFIYKYEGKTLTISEEDGWDDDTYEVASLTKSELHLKFRDSGCYIIERYKKVSDSVIAGAK